MVRRFRRSARLLGGALALALAVVSVATCLTAAEMTPAQKACCIEMKGDCGATAVERGCCPTDSPNPASILSSSPVLQFAAPAVVAVVLATQPDLPAVFATSRIVTSRPTERSSPPTYLLVSVFRI